MRLRIATIACAVLAVGLMVPFETLPTRVAGVAALIGFIVCGLFLIATPEHLGGEGANSRRSRL